MFWLKHDPVRMLDGAAPLRDAQVPADARIELAVTFPGLELLPDSIANKVPDPSKGTPLQPPGAFTVSIPLRPLPAEPPKDLGRMWTGPVAGPWVAVGCEPCSL